MLHGFRELSKEKPKDGQLCHCLVRYGDCDGEDHFNHFLAKWNGRSFFYNEQKIVDHSIIRVQTQWEELERVELWFPCDTDVDGILCDEMYDVEESDLKQNRYMSKRTIPE